MANITNITEAITALRNLADDLPTAVTIDITLTNEGQAADAKAVGDAILTHTQAASTINAGTFSGAVVAQPTSQIPTTPMLRNSCLVPTTAVGMVENNGEICWMYE